MNLGDPRPVALTTAAEMLERDAAITGLNILARITEMCRMLCRVPWAELPPEERARETEGNQLAAWLDHGISVKEHLARVTRTLEAAAVLRLMREQLDRTPLEHLANIRPGRLTVAAAAGVQVIRIELHLPGGMSELSIPLEPAGAEALGRVLLEGAGLRFMLLKGN